MEKGTNTYQFSKEQNEAALQDQERGIPTPALRSEKAAEIREIRSEKRAETAELGEAYKKERLIGIALDRIQQEEDYLRGLENNSIDTIEDLLLIEEVRKSIDDQKAETSEDDLMEAQAELQKLLEARKYRHDVDEARQVLGEFWQGQSEAYAEFQEEQKLCSVDAVSNNYDCLLIHAFTVVSLSENSLIKSGATVEDKLDVLLALNPTIATSTIKSGDTARNIWSGTVTGVGIVSGKVLDAWPGDGGTEAKGIRERVRYGRRPGKTSKRVDEAINERSDNDYNELTVEDPAIGYLYFCIDESAGNTPGNPSMSRMSEIAKSRGLPFYLLENGALYEAKEVTKRSMLGREHDITYFEKGDEIRRSSALSHEPILSEQQSLLQEKILHRGLLRGERISPVEKQKTEYYQFGKQYFWVLHAKEMAKAHQNLEVFSQPGSLSVVQIGEEKREYYIADGELQYHYDRQGESHQSGADSICKLNTSGGSGASGSIRNIAQGQLAKFNLDQEVDDFGDYLRQMVEKIDQLSAGENQVAVDLACHLYGFADEARANERGYWAVQAEEAASKAYDPEEFREMISTRLDERGNFKLTREELGVERKNAA